MEIKIIENEISLKDLEEIAKDQFVEMIKAVVDIDKCIMAVGGDLHADEEAMLLDSGSLQKNLWGINIYFEGDDIIEFDSMINIRPSQGNRSRGVENLEIQEKIRKIISKLIKK